TEALSALAASRNFPSGETSRRLLEWPARAAGVRQAARASRSRARAQRRGMSHSPEEGIRTRTARVSNHAIIEGGWEECNGREGKTGAAPGPHGRGRGRRGAEIGRGRGGSGKRGLTFQFSHCILILSELSLKVPKPFRPNLAHTDVAAARTPP